MAGFLKSFKLWWVINSLDDDAYFRRKSLIRFSKAVKQGEANFKSRELERVNYGANKDN